MKRAEEAAQVAKSNRDDASPKGESNPLEGTSLGHFRLVLVGLPTRWKSATRVRESSDGPVVLEGAAAELEVGLCVGGRDASRPSRPPHGHAGRSSGGQTRLRGRERPPAQPQLLVWSARWE